MSRKSVLGQNLFEEDVVTGLDIGGESRAVHPEERECEQPVSLLDDTLPGGWCVRKQRQLEEMALMDFTLPVVRIVVHDPK